MQSILFKNRDTSRHIIAMIALSAMMFLQNIDISAVNLALASIAKTFDAHLSTMTWILNIYAMAAGGFMILCGRLGDIFGRRYIFIIGTLIFGISSLVSGFAFDTFGIIFGRFFQGIGMALIFPQLIALSALAYPAERRSNAIALMVSIAGLSQAIGPTLGGYIIEWFSWRYIFLINFPICLISVMLIKISVTESKDEAFAGNIDYVGAALMIMSFFLITLALNEVQDWGFSSNLFLSCLLAGIIILVGFIFLESRLKFPLIDIKLFSQKNYLLPLIIRNSCIYSMTTVMLVMALFMQNILHYSPSKAGKIFLGMTFLFGIISLGMGRVVSVLGEKGPLLIGCFLGAIGLWWLSSIGAQTSILYIVVGLCLIGIHLGIVMPTTVSIALGSVPTNKISVASGVFYTAVFLSLSTAVAVSSTLLHSLGAYFFHRFLTGPLIYIHINELVFAGIYSGAQATIKIPSSIIILHIAQSAFIAATHWVFKLAALIQFLGFILCLGVTAKPFR